MYIIYTTKSLSTFLNLIAAIKSQNRQKTLFLTIAISPYRICRFIFVVPDKHRRLSVNSSWPLCADKAHGKVSIEHPRQVKNKRSLDQVILKHADFHLRLSKNAAVRCFLCWHSLRCHRVLHGVLWTRGGTRQIYFSVGTHKK